VAICLAAAGGFATARAAPPKTLPNVVVVLADDLGYGDVQCFNPERGKISASQIDRLASQGMRFTDHCCLRLNDRYESFVNFACSSS
jgi:hypothetical protein